MVDKGGALSSSHVLINTLIQAKNLSQKEVAQKAEVHTSNLSKFLSGETDMRLSTFIKLMETLEVDIISILQSEVDRSLGRSSSNITVGQAVENLLNEVEPITARTILNSISSRIKNDSNKKIENSLKVLNGFNFSSNKVKRS